ncbi:hypothetical protein EVAR_96416_1 [Eumeta japonica]|uniref:Uncharacterized protein n=1 Tax=Eumeta variegata TaxID=151549 RepID=A0A4C1WAG5_EUMVA|nr:hypothetical protein EVAR_96416_1 [Eumeta japonica]
MIANIGSKVNGHSLMNSKSASQQVRLAIYNRVLIFTLLYGSESWLWQKKNETSQRGGDAMKDRCRNSDVKQRCELKGRRSDSSMEKGMLRWSGRLELMKESRLP